MNASVCSAASWRLLAKADTGLQNKTFHCETCDVHVNSETQLKQHISSRRHKDRAAGKPAKPKYSPYTKTQRGATKHTVKMSAGKDLCPPLTTRILPSHLAAVAAAAAAVGSAFPLRVPAITPRLFRLSPSPPRCSALHRGQSGLLTRLYCLPLIDL
ncbi:zinc finger protein 385D-like [Puntigrus tetrazona]|uniref:zinc finger protein 385D-like n=1 Tax=Puntigrus tetrazona TaxID=1606681 RepID=UPI001C898785|nr:zinc finger protein 385D-like [Puntigrus tetrazona]